MGRCVRNPSRKVGPALDCHRRRTHGRVRAPRRLPHAPGAPAGRRAGPHRRPPEGGAPRSGREELDAAFASLGGIDPLLARTVTRRSSSPGADPSRREALARLLEERDALRAAQPLIITPREGPDRSPGWPRGRRPGWRGAGPGCRRAGSPGSPSRRACAPSRSERWRMVGTAVPAPSSTTTSRSSPCSSRKASRRRACALDRSGSQAPSPNMRMLGRDARRSAGSAGCARPAWSPRPPGPPRGSPRSSLAAGRRALEVVDGAVDLEDPLRGRSRPSGTGRPRWRSRRMTRSPSPSIQLPRMRSRRGARSPGRGGAGGRRSPSRRPGPPRSGPGWRASTKESPSRS